MKKYKLSKTNYQSGLEAANAHITYMLRHHKAADVREACEKLHDKADHEQFTTRAKFGDAAAQYSQGKAMGYGQYSHTGRRILK